MFSGILLTPKLPFLHLKMCSKRPNSSVWSLLAIGYVQASRFNKLQLSGYIFVSYIIELFLGLDVPGAPSNLRASDVHPESVTLDWTKPRSDGSSPITSYIIERREALSNYWTQAGTVDGHRTNFTIPNLRPGTEYHFRVFAENEMGVSEPCTISTAIKLPGGAGMCCLGYHFRFYLLWFAKLKLENFSL